MIDPAVLLLGLLVALVVLAWLVRELAGLRRDRARGRLVAVDLPGQELTLRSERWALVGRPDEIRRDAEGRWIPVEWKRRRVASTGPPPSDRIQVGAYCLLVEERTGRSPPYGLLRYGDGSEWEVPWTPSAREEIVRLLATVRRPYSGAATPSAGRCGRCRWHDVCDARWA